LIQLFRLQQGVALEDLNRDWDGDSASHNVLRVAGSLEMEPVTVSDIFLFVGFQTFYLPLKKLRSASSGHPSTTFLDGEFKISGNYMAGLGAIFAHES
jgi:hypothetical protein